MVIIQIQVAHHHGQHDPVHVSDIYGTMQDEFVEFWSFFRHHYCRRNSMC